MIRLIPPKTKTSSTLFAGFTFRDFRVCFIYVLILFIIAFSGLDTIFRYCLIACLAVIMITSLLKVEFEMRAYTYYIAMANFGLRKRKIQASSFKEATGIQISSTGLVDASEGLLKSKAVEVKGIDFGILTEKTQDSIIDHISTIFKMVKHGSIFKIEKPIDFSSYIAKNNEKIKYWETLIQQTEDSDKIIRYKKRIEVLENVSMTLSHLHEDKAVRAEAFYFVAYDYNEDALLSVCRSIKGLLEAEGIEAELVDEQNMKIFYQQFYNTEFNEDNDFILNAVHERWNKLKIGEEIYKIATLTGLPSICGNAWAWELFAIPDTKVRLHFSQASDKSKQYSAINKSIIELQGRLSEKNLTESKKIDINNDIDSLQLLLQQLKMDNEQLHTVTFFILYPEYASKKVDEIIRNNNIYVNHLYFHQLEAYLSMQPYNLPQKNLEKKISINLQSSTLAATFPFVSHLFLDPDGDYLGDSRYPVFFDIFDSWKKHHALRTNSNIVIIGKSGGGKSFFTKKMLLQQACNGTKIFALDPENEYQVLASNLGGNWIDMGGITSGKINPFHVFPSLSDDSSGSGELKSQRQFLQEFFTITMPTLDEEARPFLNQAIQMVYLKKNITDETDFSVLPAEAYPTFDDLYQVAKEAFLNPKTYDFDKINWRRIVNTLEDFRDGGLYSNLWNGPTTMKLENEFTVLNFQSLFANNNTVVANGQMLLAMRFLMQEVIKNKARNEDLGLNNNIQIVVDEAHQFINPEFPVALTFMSQMTKRIRKYGGGMVVTTQNIKDFIGQSEATKAKATAVLNGCQYSAIFGLLPDDVNSVIDLYRSYNGGLTQAEIDALTSARQGEALFMIDYKTRVTAKIELYYNEIQYLEKR